MKTLFCLIPLLFFACGPGAELPPGDVESAPPATQPAPGATPQPEVSGDIDYSLLTPGQLREVEGCTYLFWPENGTSDRYVYGFNYGEGPAEGFFGGAFQTLEVVSEEETEGSVSGPVTFVHENDDYQVTTTVTRERQIDNELWELSGTVVVRDRASGKTLRIRVLGEQGC
ncbi:hypothetical protein CLV84_0208 [Neolewinella xylanilytica]|uniref:Lipoprotein n=1 Tax=Neolewinella xylanilytica TaxID=1514080 RepID=A0A2S6I709_9BACT|nr:hypothetical protein [Neolewinella xylanilytica]PPK87270.1 hypothetical protein CLV84_0208 [Neolewinella xylanilytica]